MIWFALIFVFLIIEAMSLNLVTIWFAFGSLCTFITTYFTENIIIQLKKHLLYINALFCTISSKYLIMIM